nr:hypothetical protein [Tanacetum cinerariifolium]
MSIPKFNRTKKFLYKIDELRAIFGHMLGASRVQIPENNLDNLHSISEEGTLELVDPQEFLGLSVLHSIRIGSLRGTIAVVAILVKGHTFPTNVKVRPVDEMALVSTTLFFLFKLGCDPLALESKFTPVEESTGVLKTMFVEDVVLAGVFPDKGICSVNLIVLSLFFRFTAISLVPKSLMQGQPQQANAGSTIEIYHQQKVHPELRSHPLTSWQDVKSHQHQKLCHPIPGGFSDCTGSDFLIVGIRTVIDPDSNLQKVYVPQWNVTNGSCLDDGDVCREMDDEFAPPKFFASVRGMEHEQLFTEFNVGAARQMSLSAEVRMCVEYNIRERRRWNSIVEEKDALLKAKDEEIGSLKAQLVLKEAKATEAIRLRAEASNFQVVEKSLQSEVTALKECNNLLKIEKSGLDVTVADLPASVKVREQEVADLDAMVTSVKLQNGNLVDQNSTQYISTLGAAIGKAVEKGTQDGLSAGITHGAEGRVLADVAAYNPPAEADYLASLQHLQSVNFSLIVELKSNKDASIDTIINLLRLEGSLAEKLGLTKSQPHVDQLMVPIHHSPDQRVVGASALSLSLDVSSSRVRRIKEYIAKHRLTLRDVFVPLSEPLSVKALTGTKSTLNVFRATVDTTTALGSLLPSPQVLFLLFLQTIMRSRIRRVEIVQCMTRSSTKELFTLFKDPERESRSSRKLFKTLSLDESRSPEFNIYSDLEEYSRKKLRKQWQRQ